MRTPVFCAALLASLAFGAAAHAQSIRIGPGGVHIDQDRGGRIDRDEAVHIAHRNGIRDIDDVDRHGRDWVVRGENRHGDRMRVTIDSHDGSTKVVTRR